MRLGFNSTISRKERICKVCGKPCYWFSKQRCQQCSTQQDTLKRMERETEKMIVEEDLSGLIEDAYRVISQYVRLRDADDKGIVACFTCGVKKHWTLQQCGHYVKRSNLYLRWDESRNLRVQCVHCNQNLHGNMPEYTKRLEEICKGITDILRSDSYLIHKPTRDEIRAVISEYTPKVNYLKKQLK